MIYYELSPSQLEAKASDHFEKGMIPERVKVDKGTIVIDRAIQESGNTGRDNFTVIHECFHQVLHPKCFKNRGADYSRMCTQKSFKNDTERRKNMSAIDIIEYQTKTLMKKRRSRL